MTRPPAPRTARSSHRATFATVVALAFYVGTAWSSDDVPKPGSQPLDEVVISAQAYDRRTLDHVIIPHSWRESSISSRARYTIGCSQCWRNTEGYAVSAGLKRKS
jgi:hypothetical protein